MKQPSTDFIIILHPTDLKKMKIKANDYVKLKNTITNGTETLDLEILAQIINSEDNLSKMNSKSLDSLKPGEVGVDQSYREALGLQIGKKVSLSLTKKKYGFMEKLLTLLDFQKSIVRVQANAPYMEHRTPVVCLCNEILNSIGATYGDRIVVESDNTKITVKCTSLIPSMQEFHDFVLDPSDKDMKEKIKTQITRMYFIDPAQWGIKSERLEVGEMTHPIFMDAISMNLLGVKRLYPVKIRKSLWWEIQKKLNSFGNVSLIGLSVMLGFVVQDPSSKILWGWVALLGIWGSWSVLTSSTYKTSSNG